MRMCLSGRSSKEEENTVAPGGALKVRHFFGSFVDQNGVDLGAGVISQNGVGDVLEHRGFSDFGRRYDQAALALANGAKDVDGTTNKVVAGALDFVALVWVDGDAAADLWNVLKPSGSMPLISGVWIGGAFWALP